MSLVQLKEVKVGSKIKLAHISGNLKAELVRLGLCTGDIIKCIAKIPNGAIVLQKGLQEIALGQHFARQIEVELIDA